MRPIWAEINLDKARHNAEEIRRFVGGEVLIMAIVKANGYGHGALPVSLEIEEVVDMYGAAILEEALLLREGGIKKPILVLGYTRPEDYGLLLERDIIQTVYSMSQALALEETACKRDQVARIHLKIDTGMNRLGFSDGVETLEVIRAIEGLDHVRIEGIFSHIANGGSGDLTYSRRQLDRYRTFVEKAETLLGRKVLKHLANSATLVELKEAHFDMVRPGLMLYGSFSTMDDNIKQLKLKKIMELKGSLSQIKEVGIGEPVSYNGTFVTKRVTQVGILPLGYGDGFARALSNRGSVLVGGVRVPIIGNVCMDQLMLDLTDAGDVRVGGEVLIYGEANPVEDFASLLGTISYEVYCAVSERIPRIYVRS